MTDSKENNSESVPVFVLKHRIAGAAFLICFGVIFLPWLLGTPSEANKSATGVASDIGEGVSPDQYESELLASVDNLELEDVEVYVSKITPLDSIPVSRGDEEKTSVESTPAAEKQVASAAQTATESEVSPQVVKDQQPEEVKQEALKEEVAEETPATETAKSEPEIETPPVIPVKEPLAKLNESVEIGWVVQIGVYTDGKGVEKVLSDLKSRGFRPSTTEVDTNKGVGTRIWLGPYAQRVEAAKSMASLKEKTGSDGFIRAYP